MGLPVHEAKAVAPDLPGPEEIQVHQDHQGPLDPRALKEDVVNGDLVDLLGLQGLLDLKDLVEIADLLDPQVLQEALDHQDPLDHLGQLDHKGRLEHQEN